MGAVSRRWFVSICISSSIIAFTWQDALAQQVSTGGGGFVGSQEKAGDQELLASAQAGFQGTPQSSGAEDIVATGSSGSSTALEDPVEPQVRYIDNVCGAVTDLGSVELEPAGSILRGETSGCLLQLPPERVAESPRGRGPRAPQPPSPARIMDRVIELVAAPELDIAPSEIGLTGLETYVWVERPAPVSVSAAAGGTTVEARASATQYLWDWGDGDDTLTYDSGRAWSRYREGSIGHLYETRGRYDLSVEVIWEAQWRINGGAWQALGFFSLSDSVDYPVRQVQARLTRTTD